MSSFSVFKTGYNIIEAIIVYMICMVEISHDLLANDIFEKVSRQIYTRSISITEKIATTNVFAIRFHLNRFSLIVPIRKPASDLLIILGPIINPLKVSSSRPVTAP